MRSVQRVCLDVLGVKEELPGTALSFASAETIRERAPKQVTKPETLDFQTLTPEKGGLFDYRVFGPGTVIDAAPLSDHEMIKPPKTQFARITLALPIVNPLVVAHAPDDLVERASVSAQMLELGDDYGNLVDALQLAGLNGMVLRELPVLPPDLRPLRRLEDDRWAISPLNDLYRHVVYRNNRLARLVEQSAPDVILASERRQLHEAILHLFDGHADRSHSLRGVCGDELVTALLELDKQPVTPGETMLARHYRALAVVFALGFDMGRAG